MNDDELYSNYMLYLYSNVIILCCIIMVVTADYKAACMMMKRKGCEDEACLGGKGMDKEFCIYCLAIKLILT